MCMNGINCTYSIRRVTNVTMKSAKFFLLSIICREMELQSYLKVKVIKTNNVAKVRNEAVDIVDFLPECGD